MTARLTRRLVLLLNCAPWMLHSYAQSPEDVNSKQAQFEVASVKPNPGCLAGHLLPVETSTGRFNSGCSTLEQLIRGAYVTYADGATSDSRARGVQISGGPAWVKSEYYTINAKAAGTPSRIQMFGPMTRSLLEDRFKLKVHWEEKIVPIYRLSVLKREAGKLQRAKKGDCAAIGRDGHPVAQSGEAQLPLCGERMHGIDPITIEVHGMTIDTFAAQLSRRMDRTVVDETGLEGEFNFQLEFFGDDATPGYHHRAVTPATMPDTLGPSIFRALEEQIGLRLEASRGTAKVIVIDHIEKPSEN